MSITFIEKQYNKTSYFYNYKTNTMYAVDDIPKFAEDIGIKVQNFYKLKQNKLKTAHGFIIPDEKLVNTVLAENNTDNVNPF